MRKLKFLEKVLMFILTVVFITTFFFSTIFSLKPLEEDPRFFFIGLLIFAINIGAFFFTIKILRKHYNHRNHKGIRIYYYIMMGLPLYPTIGFLGFYNHWQYSVVYFCLIGMYAYLINKEFGRLSLKINKDHDGDLFAGDLHSFNGEIQVRGKNKKIKGSMERIAIGDVITISRDGEPVITLNVIKNTKKS